ncbi:hypothetical protein M1N18_00835 [Dehalococcoidales bacterium]|nr:hypothetical protein [Dehalococcoidales bacterium]MCL0053274.1 hypothetical protein [Dehalococcoidales bacterium]
MKFGEVTSKLVFPSALVAIGCYIFIVFISWRYIVYEPPDAVLILFPLAVTVCLLSSGGAVFALGITMKCPAIRVAAGVLGVLGGVMNALSMPIPWLAIEPTLVSLMAIGGGIFALRRPGVGGILMLLATIVTIPVVWWGWGPFGPIIPPLMFLGGLLALASALTSDKKRAGIYVAMTLGIIGGLLAVLCTLMAHMAPPGWVEPFILLRGQEVLAFWIWVFLFPGMGLLGGILVLAKPKLAGILMLTSGIIGPVGVVALGILEEPSLLMIGGLAGLFLIIAGTIAFIIKKWQQQWLLTGNR